MHTIRSQTDALASDTGFTCGRNRSLISEQDWSKIGWDKWLTDPEVEQTPTGQRNRLELIVSEDGLMLNTGIFFVRYAFTTLGAAGF